MTPLIGQLDLHKVVITTADVRALSAARAQQGEVGLGLGRDQTAQVNLVRQNVGPGVA
jgi:hypothetical protein